MNVSWISDGLALIELTPEETENLGLSFSREDYSSPKLRRCLWEILTKAEEVGGKPISVTSNLTLDFMPDKKGGCLMIVSEDSSGESHSDAAVYQTEDFENIIGFVSALKNISHGKSALYQRDKSYRLYLENAPDEGLAHEFCLDIFQGDLHLESTLEGYNCLIADNASEILSGFFLKK